MTALQRDAPPERQGHAVPGQGVRVGRGLVDLARAAGGQDDRFRAEDVRLTGGQVVRDDAGHPHRLVVGHLGSHQVGGEQQVEGVELVEERDVGLDALLVEGLQDHVAGAVCGVARAAHRGLAMVAGVPAELALVDQAVRGPVERQPHVLQVQHRIDGLAGHHLRGVLVHQVVAALDGVEGVPLPVVLLDVAEGGAHPALGRAGVRPGGVELAEHGRAGPGGRLERRPHPRAPGADDDDVVLVGLHRVWSVLG